MSKPVGVLLPDWSDPFLPDPVTALPTHLETELRDQLGLLALRLHELGPTLAARETLRLAGRDQTRMVVLLALAGCAPWQEVGPGAAIRLAADNVTYELRAAEGEGAPHAEHAVVTLAQHLRIGPASITDTATLAGSGGILCLSLVCALRDVVLRLGTAGEMLLATEVACAGGLDAALLPSPATARVAA